MQLDLGIAGDGGTEAVCEAIAVDRIVAEARGLAAGARAGAAGLYALDAEALTA